MELYKVTITRQNGDEVYTMPVNMDNEPNFEYLLEEAFNQNLTVTVQDKLIIERS